jgi:hypothetical protein
MTHHHHAGRIVGIVASIGISLGVMTQASSIQAGPSPRDIMNKVTQARKLDGSEAVVKMSIIEPNGTKREREISMATKLYDGGETEKRLYRFLAPADVKGTGILVFDYTSKADDIWIFMPALRKTRRVVSSERSKSFMGSDFSYGDLNIPALDEFDYAMVKEDDVGGDKCWVIDVTPKSPDTAKAEGYAKKTYWVSQKSNTVRKAVFMDTDGKALKELKTDDVKLLDPKKNRYRTMRMEMTNKKTGRKSVFDTSKIAFAPDTKDEYFTPRYLERE